MFTCIFSVKYVMYHLITLYDHSEHLVHINIFGSSICSKGTEIALPIKRVWSVLALSQQIKNFSHMPSCSLGSYYPRTVELYYILS